MPACPMPFSGPDLNTIWCGRPVASASNSNFSRPGKLLLGGWATGRKVEATGVNVTPLRERPVNSVGGASFPWMKEPASSQPTNSCQSYAVRCRYEIERRNVENTVRKQLCRDGVANLDFCHNYIVLALHSRFQVCKPHVKIWLAATSD
jgi:hypothetical protein